MSPETAPPVPSPAGGSCSPRSPASSRTPAFPALRSTTAFVRLSPSLHQSDRWANSRGGRIRHDRRCAGSRTAKASSPGRDNYRSASAPADSIPAPHPRRPTGREAGSAPMYRRRRDEAAPRRESAAPCPHRRMQRLPASPFALLLQRPGRSLSTGRAWQ